MALVRNRATLLYHKHKHPSLIFDDVEAECWLTFFKCADLYTPDKGQLSTYFYGAVALESDRIVARALGFTTDHKRNCERNLKRDVSRDLSNVAARFWPRTTPTPTEILERLEDIDRGRHLALGANPLDRFMVIQWLRNTKRSVILRELGFGATTLSNRRRHTLSEMALYAQPIHPRVDLSPPPVAQSHPDIL